MCPARRVDAALPAASVASRRWSWPDIATRLLSVLLLDGHLSPGANPAVRLGQLVGCCAPTDAGAALTIPVRRLAGALIR